MVSGWGNSGESFVSNGGVLAPTWQSVSFDSTDDYNLSGSWNWFDNTATSTFNQNVDIAASSTDPLTLNDVPYVFPAAGGASTTALMNNGSNKLFWVSPDWELLVSTTTQQNMNAATTTVSAANDLRIIFYSKGVSTAAALTIRFNGDYTANYGWNTTDTGTSAVLDSGTKQTAISLSEDGTGTTSPAYFTIDISNEATLPKIANWQGTFGTSFYVGGRVEGGGIWANTANQITTITFDAQVGSGYTITAGSIIKVYGRL